MSNMVSNSTLDRCCKKERKSSKVVVYGLGDPLTNELRYIGVTRSSLNKRLGQHVAKSSYHKKEEYRIETKNGS